MTRRALVTGASSGLGRALAERLAELGWCVFAGFRRPADGRALDGLGDGVVAVPLDVTSDEHVRACAARIDADAAGLDALVHNAGIVVPGPLELLSVDDLRESFEVNLFGVQRLTTALLPQVRAARGRLVCVSSISGRVGFPFEGAYNASKFALSGWAETLRRELEDVPVVLVEPGPIRTPIWDRIRARWRLVRERAPAADAARYRHASDAFERELEHVARRAEPVERVVAVLVRALTDRRPRARYVVGRSARLWSLASRLAPAAWIDRRLALHAERADSTASE